MAPRLKFLYTMNEPRNSGLVIVAEECIMTTIVLADSQRMVRHGLRSLLEEHDDVQIVGEASNGKEACFAVQELKPDVLVMDIMMDGLDGIDATRYITRNFSTSVIMLSIHTARCYVAEAIQSGAMGYVLKQSPFSDLLAAISRVKAGERYFSEPIADLALSCEQEAEVNAMTPFTPLTSRERDVFYLLAQGFTNAEIAQQLFISRRTAETHRSQIMRKLGLHHMVELVFYALREGINKDTLAAGFNRENPGILNADAIQKLGRELVMNTN
jgi:DNA-binding NarL/FixJ family response regulator